MATEIVDVVNELKSLRISLPKVQSLPDEELLELYEHEIGIKFHADYRYFLKEASDSIFNGKDALRVTIDKNSPRELIKFAHLAWQEGVPPNWLPICEDNGDYYCITAGGEVFFWSHDGRAYESWPSLAMWIKSVWINGE